MSDQPLDNATNSVAPSEAVAPPNPAGDQQGSTPAPVDTTANGQAEPSDGETPEQKQTRRESRAFATLRRENRELYRRLGGLEVMLEQRAPQSQPPAEGEQPSQQRQTRSSSPVDEAQAELNRSILERIEDAGEDYEEVVEKITDPRFPLSVAMRDFLATSDKPAEVAKLLADDPKEAQRISLLGERAADRAMERLEQRASAKPAPKTTKAPPPVPTVGGRSTPEFDPHKADMDEYAQHWQARQAKR